MSLEQEIHSLDDEKLAAMSIGDAQKLEQLLADDLTYVTALGMSLSKAQILAAVASGEFRISSSSSEEYKVRVYSDTAIATCRTTMTSSYRNQSRSGQYWATSVYARVGERWKLVAQQTTLVPSRAVPQETRAPALAQAAH
jgi:uncharacterized protein (TIGR02246 family)